MLGASRLAKVLRHPMCNVLSKTPHTHGSLGQSTDWHSVVARSVHTGSSSSKQRLDLLPQTNSEDDFYQHLQAGTLDRSLAAAYLKQADSSGSLNRHIGTATINWLWNEHDNITWRNDWSLLRPLTNLLVREQQEELLWNWMEQQQSGQPTNIKTDKRFEWRSCALRALVETKATQTREQGSLDASLRACFCAKRSSVPIPLDLTKEYLADELTTPTPPVCKEDGPIKETYEELKKRMPWPNTSPTLRQAFRNDIKSRSWPARRRQAYIGLYDAAEPNPDPFLEYCDRITARSERTKTSRQDKQYLVWKVHRQCRDTGVILRHKGRHEDADWLADFAFYRTAWHRGSIKPRPQSREFLAKIYSKAHLRFHGASLGRDELAW